MAEVHGRVPRILLLGAGDRGQVYAGWIHNHPGRLRLVALAEPRPELRSRVADEHAIPQSARFLDWRDALAAAPDVDGVIIALQDALHRDAAVAALETGAHVLLEKPMATTALECREIALAARNARPRGASLTLCHVLRYSAFFQAVKRLLDEGALGEVQSIYHAENVSYYHFAHSYVRGNWGNSSTSSPVILAKSSHDLDILCWLTDSRPVSVASTAARTYFAARNTPPGAPPRCTDGCPVAQTCLYESRSTYLYGLPIKRAIARGRGIAATGARLMLRAPRLARLVPGLARYSLWNEWPTSTITGDLTRAGILHALETGPYGRCVYQCDNDQPDHQETIIRFQNGITASFRVHGRSHEEGRTLRIDGSRATLRGKFGSGTSLEVHRHGARRPRRIPVTGDFLGHSEADTGLMDAWADIFRGSRPPSDAETSLASHLLAFAAADSAAGEISDPDRFGP